MLDKILDNSVYLVLAIILTIAVGYDITLSDQVTYRKALETNQKVDCELIKVSWIKFDCYKALNPGIITPKIKTNAILGKVLYMGAIFFTVLGFTLLLKLLKKIIWNSESSESKFTVSLESFLERVTNVDGVGWRRDIKILLISSSLCFLGTMLLALFIVNVLA